MALAIYINIYIFLVVLVGGGLIKQKVKEVVCKFYSN